MNCKWLMSNDVVLSYDKEQNNFAEWILMTIIMLLIIFTVIKLFTVLEKPFDLQKRATSLSNKHLLLDTICVYFV